jgi:acyl-CoA synthetase (AMP-forming)/AMP-acid ligase II
VPGHRLVPVDGADIPSVVEEALASGADAISSTPTFWRLAFLAVPERELQRLPLGQITLGGEIVDDAVLARLRGLYPQAALTHIYASSEAGASIVVNDGRAGFPARWLASAGDARSPGGIALKMEDGRLLVKSPFSSRASGGRPDEWVDTGDRIEVRDDRALFLGRSEAQMINVGGNKAYPADIEAVLLSHPRVAWCRVSARKAAIVGFLPVAEVLLSDGDRRTAEQALFSHCSARLPDFAVPRMWTFVDRIPVTGALKSEVEV